MGTCPQISEQNRCGSLIYDDDGNSLGKAKYICLKSCGRCDLPPTSSPTEFNDVATEESPTSSPTASSAPSVSSAPTVCGDMVSLDSELKLKNQILTCPQISEQNRCGSLIYDDNGNSLGKAKYICVNSCGGCKIGI